MLRCASKPGEGDAESAVMLFTRPGDGQLR